MYSKLWKWVSWQKLENSSVQISLIPGGVKIWKRNFEMHFKGMKFAQMITNMRNSFPGRLSDTIG